MLSDSNNLFYQQLDCKKEESSGKNSFNINPKHFTYIQNDSINEFHWIFEFKLKNHHVIIIIPDSVFQCRRIFVLVNCRWIQTQFVKTEYRNRWMETFTMAAKANGKNNNNNNIYGAHQVHGHKWRNVNWKRNGEKYRGTPSRLIWLW